MKGDSGRNKMSQYEKEFSEWAVLLAKNALKYQDKTFRQLVHEKIVPSWTEYLFKQTRG